MALSGVYGYGLSPYIANGFNKSIDGGDDINDIAVSQQENTVAEESIGSPVEDKTPKAPKASNPEDFTFDFKKNNSYNLVAATSPVDDIDVEKAVSEMNKDEVLNQYKFFVGHTNLGTDADGTVRLKNIGQL